MAVSDVSSGEQELPEYPTVGVIVAGGVKLTYKCTVSDLMGLDSIVMGHSQGNRKGTKNHAALEKDVFFESPPDIVTPMIDNFVQQSKYNSQKLNDKNLLKGIYYDYRFQKLYQYARISIKSSDTNKKRGETIGEFAIRGFFHRNFLPHIVGNPYYNVEFSERLPLSSY